MFYNSYMVRGKPNKESHKGYQTHPFSHFCTLTQVFAHTVAGQPSAQAEVGWNYAGNKRPPNLTHEQISNE